MSTTQSYADDVLDALLSRLVQATRGGWCRWTPSPDGAIYTDWPEASSRAFHIVLAQPAISALATGEERARRVFRVNGCQWLVEHEKLAPLYDAMLDYVAGMVSVKKPVADADFAEVGEERAASVQWWLVAHRTVSGPVAWRYPIGAPADGKSTYVDHVVRALIKRLGLQMPPTSWWVGITQVISSSDEPETWPGDDETKEDRRVPRHDEETVQEPAAAAARAPKYWLVIDHAGRRYSMPVPPHVVPPKEVTQQNLIATLGYIGGGSLPDLATIGLTTNMPHGTYPWRPVSGADVAGVDALEEATPSLPQIPLDREEIARFVEATFKKHGWVRHPNYAAATATLDEIVRGLRGEP